MRPEQTSIVSPTPLPDLIQRGAQSRERLCTLVVNAFKDHGNDPRVSNALGLLVSEMDCTDIQRSLRILGIPLNTSKGTTLLDHLLQLIRQIPCFEEKNASVTRPDIRETAQTLLSFARKAQATLLDAAKELAESPARRDLYVTHERIMRLGDEARKKLRSLVRPPSTLPAPTSAQHPASRNGRKSRSTDPRSSSWFQIPLLRPSDDAFSRWEQQQAATDGLTHQQRLARCACLYLLRNDTKRCERYMKRRGIGILDAHRMMTHCFHRITEHPHLLTVMKQRIDKMLSPSHVAVPHMKLEPSADDALPAQANDVADILLQPFISQELLISTQEGDADVSRTIPHDLQLILVIMEPLHDAEALELQSLLSLPYNQRSAEQRTRVNTLIVRQRGLEMRTKEATEFADILQTPPEARSSLQEQRLRELALDFYG